MVKNRVLILHSTTTCSDLVWTLPDDLIVWCFLITDFIWYELSSSKCTEFADVTAEIEEGTTCCIGDQAKRFMFKFFTDIFVSFWLSAGRDYNVDITNMLWRGLNMQRLPATIGGLKQLRVLDVEENRLDLLPIEIGQSTRCKVDVLSVQECLEGCPQNDLWCRCSCWRVTWLCDPSVNAAWLTAVVAWLILGRSAELMLCCVL